MTIFDMIVSNRVLVSAVLGWAIAQILKTIIDFWYTKSFSLERMWGSGGMPSSHSATVCALMTAAGMHYGVTGFEFAASFVLATIVMHDAMGVRRETGKQAKLLNMIMEHDFFDFSDSEKFQTRLKEFVGHTPLQVLMGGILGIVIAIVYNL